MGVTHFELIEEKKAEQMINRIEIKENNPAITRIEEKCVNCGICIKTCENIVGIKKDDKLCISCGQCILTCPVGSLIPKNYYNEVLEHLNNSDKTVVVMTSPAVRVSIGDAFNFKPGEFLEGKMVSSLKALGFDYVFDTSFGADLTTMEEAAELKERVNNNGKLPMFTSCCPAWVKYAEVYHQELKENISTCKSPIGMQASYIRDIWIKENNIKNEDLIIIALTPCTAKKMEIINTECDYVITTSELANILKEKAIDFKSLKEQKYDSLNGSSSGTIFGASGGVMLSALRTYYHYETNKSLPDEEVTIIDKEFYKEYSFKINEMVIKTAVVSTMPNLEKILPMANDYLFIEVMNCSGGCVNGGGQIINSDQQEIISSRQVGLMSHDKKAQMRYSYENPAIKEAYEKYLDKPLSKKSKTLLHK